MATFDDCRRLTAHLPEVGESTSYGTPSLTVRGKSFCRLWGDREHDRDHVDPDETAVLVVFCDLDEKDALIESSGGTVFSTPHYDGYPAMVIRLADVDLEDLAGYLEDSYRAKAPKRILKQLDPG
jgi:hypothetical protein